MRYMLIATVAAGFLFLRGCGGSGPADDQDPQSVPSPEFSGTLEEKADQIASFVTVEAQGLLAVTYAEIPPHAPREGKKNFGVHYNVFVIKHDDLLVRADIERLEELVGMILQLTTGHIVEDDPLISHIGVQVFAPNMWFYGGHVRGWLKMYIATREALLTLDSDAPPREWFFIAQEEVLFPQ